MYGLEEWSLRECPLPIVRRHGEAAEGGFVAEPCRAPVGVVRTHSSVLLGSGGRSEEEESWSVECANGHVLVVAEDSEEEDPIGFDQGLVTRTLNRMARFMSERDPRLAPRPLAAAEV